MSYGQQYSMTFPDAKESSNTWVAKIYISGYSGAVTQLVGTGQPIVHEMLSSDDGKFDPIKGSACTINIRSSTANQFLTDITLKAREDVYVILTKDAVDYWKGFYDAESYGEEWLVPHVVSFTFVDMLGKLKDKEFSDDGVTYWGTKTLMQILWYCLNKTGMELPLYEGINIYETSMDDGYTDSPLTQVYVNCDAFLDSDKPMSCYDVLKEILKTFGARIWQQNNRWYILPVRLIGGQYYYRVYTHGTSNYTYSTAGSENNLATITAATQAAASRNVFLNRSAYKEIDRAVRKILLTQEYKIDKNIIPNGDFTHFDENDEYPLGDWVYGSSHTFSGQQDSFTSGDLLLKWTSEYYWNYQNHIRTDGVKYNYKDDIGLKFKVRLLKAATYHFFTRFSVRLNDGGGTNYYLQSDGSWESGSFADKAPEHEFESDGSYSIFKESTLEIESDIIPDDGTIYVGLYGLYGGGVVQPTYLLELSVELIVYPTQTTQEIPSDKIYSHEINANNPSLIEDTFLLGDAPEIFLNEQLMYRNCLKTWDGSNYIPTSEWYVQDNAENKTLLSLILDHYTAFYNFNGWKITGEIQGFLNPGVLVKDSAERHFIINDYVHDLKRGTFNVTLLQIKQADVAYILAETGDIIETEAGDYVEIE